MRIKRYAIWIPLCLLALIARAQDKEAVTFELKLSKDKLGINERLRAEFEMNKDGDNFSPPDFEGFRVLMGPSTQISSSWINGVRSYSKVLSYVLQPTAQGTFTIKQATVEIDGQVYKSATKQVTVTAAVDKPSANGEMTADDIADENLHLVAEVSQTDSYLNEALSVVYKLYVSPTISVSNYRSLDNPKYNDFWSQDISTQRFPIQSGTYQGKPYRYVILRRVVLYPQKTGKLEIEPLSLEVTVDVPTQKRDFFGRVMYSQANKIISAGKRTINVKPLPTQGKPASFTGAVGTFDLSVVPTKTDLNASESLQFNVTVSGKGNMKLFQLPKPSFPGSLEVYEPEFTEDIHTDLSGMQGKVGESYTIVPSYKGKYPVPAISFSYFDPKDAQYHSLQSKEMLINVLQGPSNNGAAQVPTNTDRHAVTATGNQFNFIKLDTHLTPIGTDYFFGSTRFFVALLLPLVLIPIALFTKKKRDALASDVVGNKIKKANKLARKYLSAAKKTLGNKDAFYIALEKALHNYLKAKLHIETSEFSKDKINTLLAEKQVDDATITDFISLLKNCEMARYSPFSEVQMNQDYDKASEVISSIDKQL